MSSWGSTRSYGRGRCIRSCNSDRGVSSTSTNCLIGRQMSIIALGLRNLSRVFVVIAAKDPGSTVNSCPWICRCLAIEAKGTIGTTGYCEESKAQKTKHCELVQWHNVDCVMEVFVCSVSGKRSAYYMPVGRNGRRRQVVRPCPDFNVLNNSATS